MNGLYFIPIFSVVLMGMFTKKVPAIAANLALIIGFYSIAAGYFVTPIADFLSANGVHEFHFLGVVFAGLILFMAVFRMIAPLKTAWVHEASGDVDLTPWKYAWPLGIGIAVSVLALYIAFADTSVL
jgi:SSS family solute:Na+ symporter